MISYSNLSPEEAQLMWNALLELPGKHTYALIKKLEGQLIEQGAIQVPIPKIPVGETLLGTD